MKKMITKDMFIEVLKVLREEEIFGSFFIYPNNNTIFVTTGKYGEGRRFYFDNNNNLIDLGKIREEIEQLEIRKTQLERQLEHFTELGEEDY